MQKKSYSKLIALLNDVNELVGIDNFNELVDELDELTIPMS